METQECSELSPILLASHAGLDLGHSPGDVERKVLVARFSHQHHVFDAHAADFNLVLPNLLSVKVAQVKLVEVLRDLAVKEEVAEVAAWLDGDHVACLDDASSAHIGKAGKGVALGCVRQVPSHIVRVQTNEVTETMRHEKEWNSLCHHFVNVACEAAKTDKSFEDDSFRNLVAFDPVSTGSELGKNSTTGSEYDVVNLRLLRSEASVDRERNSHIRAVVVEGVALVRQHGLSVDQSLVVVLVVKSGCSGSTSADREVGLHTADVVVLLAAVTEEALELAFPHSRFTVLHHAHVRLGGDLS